ncbi:MAG TPA: hypothetical protein VHF51_13645 [Solirubrobacteraceae bacterium]|nr:hypothetical protein [Solirubrobacteraceae bacterium]
MISAVNPTFASAWPTGWEDVEVVDSVLVADPPDCRERPACGPAAATMYDASGRVALEGRFGRLVSVLA